MRRSCLSAVLGALTLALVGCLSIPPGFAPGDDGGLTHIHSGARFPQEVGAFRMVYAYPYDDAAFDVGVGYSAQEGFDAVLTVYVYPRKEDTLESGLAKVSSDVEEVTPEARALETWEVSWHDAPAIGKAVLFSFRGEFFGRTADLLSELQLYTFRQWFVMVRMTTEAQTRDQAAAAMEVLLLRIVGPK